jgi:transposase
MDAKQTGSLGGLAPVTRQSGNWQGKSFIQGGRATLSTPFHKFGDVFLCGA